MEVVQEVRAISIMYLCLFSGFMFFILIGVALMSSKVNKKIQDADPDESSE